MEAVNESTKLIAKAIQILNELDLYRFDEINDAINLLEQSLVKLTTV